MGIEINPRDADPYQVGALKTKLAVVPAVGQVAYQFHARNVMTLYNDDTLFSGDDFNALVVRVVIALCDAGDLKLEEAENLGPLVPTDTACNFRINLVRRVPFHAGGGPAAFVRMVRPSVVSLPSVPVDQTSHSLMPVRIVHKLPLKDILLCKWYNGFASSEFMAHVLKEMVPVLALVPDDVPAMHRSMRYVVGMHQHMLMLTIYATFNPYLVTGGRPLELPESVWP
jgi:hypothetical protein